VSQPSRAPLGPLDATLLVMGGVIGVGIFFTPQAVARLVPEPTAFFAAWLLGAVIALGGSMTFAELAATFPRAGGWFVYLREAFGRFPAFLFAWIVLFVISTGACAVVADFCASQVERLAGVTPSHATHLAIGAAVLIGLTLVALTGVKVGALFQDGCMLLKLGAATALVVGGIAFALRGEGVASPTLVPDAPPAPPLVRGFVQAMLPVLFSYGGWQLVTYIAPSVRDAQRTLPRALLIGMAGVTTVYLAVNATYVAVLGMDGLRSLPSFAAETATRALGPAGSTFVVASMALSSLGICAAIVLATPALYVAMSREGLFFEAFGRLHPRTGAPVAAILAQGGVALAYLAWGHAGLLTDAVVFAEWIFHALVGAALLTLRRARPELPRPFRSLAYPLFPLLYTTLAIAVVIGSLLETEWRKTCLGLGVLAVGAAVYRPWLALLGRRVVKD
jgi:APA family basic amino acid/polyamine antiporter